MPIADPLNVPRAIVLIGLMGAGKSCIGRRLAALLGLKFVDADAEIERAAGCTIEASECSAMQEMRRSSQSRCSTRQCASRKR